MSRGSRLFWCAPLSFVLVSSAMAQVPSLDSLAGHWLSGPEIVFPPSVTNTLGSLGCTENLTGFRYCTFPPIAQGGDAAVLLVDGKPLDAHSFRWFPHQAQRKATTTNGLEFLSTTRLDANAQAVLIRLELKNPGKQNVITKLALSNPTGFRRCPGVWDWDERHVNPEDGFNHVVRAGAEVIKDAQSGLEATIEGLPAGPVTVPAKGKLTFGIVCRFGPVTGSFEARYRKAASVWTKRWHDAFTPGNRTYPGNLPVLVTADAKLKRVYYMAAATMLGLERTHLPKSPRCFVTVGPQYGNTLEYFWDTALFSTVYALLDPVALRQNLRSWLNVDIHGHYAIDYLTGQGVGPWYAPNDYSVFTSFWKFGAAVGDEAFMRANAGRFASWAMAWKRLVRPGEVLADFGDNDNLLECSPAYVNMVPSLNAAHVGLMRQAALVQEPTEAEAMRSEADRLAAAVLRQYVPGEGVWKTKHRDGSEVANRHVYDYLTVGLSMTPDLTPTMRREMTAFVNRELLAEGWIRAMSLSDPNAAVSDRPDHGPKGSYAAWPAMAALTMAKFGQYDDMESLVERCEGATWQGPFPQGFELLQVPGTDRWIPRIARRGCDYNETSGAAFLETVLTGLFGVEFGLDGKVVLRDARVARPVAAKLLHVRTKGGLKDFECGRFGVR